MKKGGGFQDAHRYPGCLFTIAIAGQPERDDRVVVWPHRADVIPDRVVRPLPLGHRPNAPARIEPITQQFLETIGRVLLVYDPTPEQVADVGGKRVDLPAVAVDRQRKMATLLDPVVAVEASLQIFGLALETIRKGRVIPEQARHPRTP